MKSRSEEPTDIFFEKKVRGFGVSFSETVRELCIGEHVAATTGHIKP